MPESRYLTHDDLKNFCCPGDCNLKEILQLPTPTASESAKCNGQRILLHDELAQATITCNSPSCPPKNMLPCMLLLVPPADRAPFKVKGKIPITEDHAQQIMTLYGPIKLQPSAAPSSSRISLGQPTRTAPKTSTTPPPPAGVVKDVSNNEETEKKSDRKKITYRCLVNMKPLKGWNYELFYIFDDGIKKIKNKIGEDTTDQSGLIKCVLPPPNTRSEILIFVCNYHKSPFGYIYKIPHCGGYGLTKLSGLLDRLGYVSPPGLEFSTFTSWIANSDKFKEAIENEFNPLPLLDQTKALLGLKPQLDDDQWNKYCFGEYPFELNHFTCTSADAHCHPLLGLLKNDAKNILSAQRMRQLQTVIKFLAPFLVKHPAGKIAIISAGFIFDKYILNQLNYLLNSPSENIEDVLQGQTFRKIEKKIYRKSFPSCVALLLDYSCLTWYYASPETGNTLLSKKIAILNSWRNIDTTVPQSGIPDEKLEKFNRFYRLPQEDENARKDYFYWDDLVTIRKEFKNGEKVKVVEKTFDLFNLTLDIFRALTRFGAGGTIPFFPFDPRRDLDKKQPIERLKTYCWTKDNPKGGMLGVKLYMKTGWLPEDNARFYPAETSKSVDATVKAMLDFCDTHSLPITNHHSPGGFPPTDIIVPPKGCYPKKDPKYLRDKGYAKYPENHKDPNYDWWMAGFPLCPKTNEYLEWLMWSAFAEVAMVLKYIDATCSPNLWLKTLKQKRNFRICLAHGGSFDNVLATYFRKPLHDIYDPFNDDNTPFDPIDKHFKCSHLSAAERYPLALGTLAIVGSERFYHFFIHTVNTRLEALRTRYEKLKEHAKDVADGNSIELRFPGLVSNFSHYYVENFVKFLSDPKNNTQGSIGPTISDAFEKAKKEWRQYLEFTQKQRVDWWKQICTLAVKHKNVYTDFSYFSADTDTSSRVMCELLIADIFAPRPNFCLDHLIGEYRMTEAERKTMRERVMLGTDWGVSLLNDRLCVKEIWEFFYKCFFENRFAKYQDNDIKGRKKAVLDCPLKDFNSKNQSLFRQIANKICYSGKCGKQVPEWSLAEREKDWLLFSSDNAKSFLNIQAEEFKQDDTRSEK